LNINELKDAIADAHKKLLTKASKDEMLHQRKDIEDDFNS
jgi:hypothetical protein